MTARWACHQSRAIIAFPSLFMAFLSRWPRAQILRARPMLPVISMPSPPCSLLPDRIPLSPGPVNRCSQARQQKASRIAYFAAQPTRPAARSTASTARERVVIFRPLAHGRLTSGCTLSPPLSRPPEVVTSAAGEWCAAATGDAAASAVDPPWAILLWTVFRTVFMFHNLQWAPV